jgi:hypothetical protein
MQSLFILKNHTEHKNVVRGGMSNYLVLKNVVHAVTYGYSKGLTEKPE